MIAHRTIIACITFLVTCSTHYSFAQTSDENSKTAKDRAAESQKIAIEVARSFELTLDDDRNTVLELNPKPIQRFTNPVIGTLYSDIFIWTHHGRPEVAASIHNWYSPSRRVGSEFQSLSRKKLNAVRNGKTVWHPEVSGVEFKPLPGAATPSKSVAGRLLQMRSFARQFSVRIRAVDRPGKIDEKLRLLHRPVYRYQSTNPQLIDGALFSFVRGTDPELLLLIEARKRNRKLRWDYAFARMNSFDFQVTHNNLEVWKVPQLAPPWANVQDPAKSYISLHQLKID